MQGVTNLWQQADAFAPGGLLKISICHGCWSDLCKTISVCARLQDKPTLGQNAYPSGPGEEKRFAFKPQQE